MRLSSIAKHHRAGSGSELSIALGEEIRRHRTQRGMTQAELGRPLTRAYISAVERGRAIPSLPALALLTDRLGTPLDEFFQGVNRRMTGRYTSPHERHPKPDASPRRRR